MHFLHYVTNMKKRIINFFVVCCLYCSSAYCIVLPDYDTFQHKVAQQNSAYLAEKYDIDIALAKEQAAKVFRDPEFSFSYANNQDWNLQMGQTFDAELSYTIPLGGERAACIRAARAEVDVTRAAVADYLRNLRQQAAEAYAAAWLAMQSAQVFHASYVIMNDIARSDSLRLALGDIDMASAIQSEVEARIAYNDWQNAQVEYQNALANLSLLIGGEPVTGLSDSTLTFPPMPTASLADLQQQAVTNRADIIQAIATQHLTEQQLRVVRASQHLELTLTAGYTHAMRVRNEEAPAPPFDGFSVGFSIPLKFSSANRGNIRAAKAQMDQAAQNVVAMEQQIRAEVQEAYFAYEVKFQLMNGFRGSILSDASMVLNRRTEGYRKGEISLVELIAARSTYNNLYQTYLENCADAFVAQATLFTALGE